MPSLKEARERARRVDLIVLPTGLSGTNCGNCRFFNDNFCTHQKVQLPVNNRMCCILWDATGTVHIGRQPSIRQFDAGFERQHPRGQPGNPGKFALKPGSSSRKASISKTSGPPKIDFVPAPSPTGKAGRKAGGFSATGRTNTDIGDLGEAVARKFNLRSLLPPGKRQNPLDVEYDDSGWAFEIKTVTTASTEYKIKMKSHEQASKLAYAKQHGFKPGSIIIVMDVKANRAFVYWREGIANYRLTEQWNFMGSASL